MKESYLDKARRLLEQGEYQKALLTISRGLITQPGNLEALRLKCQSLMELGRYREVIATVDGAPAHLRDDLELQTYKGEAYYFLRDYRRASQILNSVYAQDPENRRVEILLEQILLEQQKALGRKPTVVGSGDAEDLYGWKDVLDSLGLRPEDLPPEFLSKVGDDSTALDLPAVDEDEDPTATMPMEAPNWLQEMDWWQPPEGTGEPEEEPTPIVEEDPVIPVGYDPHEEPTRKGPPQDAPTRLVAPRGGLPPRRTANPQSGVRTKVLGPSEEAPTKDYTVPQEDDVPTKDYTVPQEDEDDLEKLPTQEYHLSGKREDSTGDFVVEFHSMEPLEAPPQEELGEVEGEIEVSSDSSMFTMEPELPSISVDLTSLEELPPLPSLSEGPSLPPIPENEDTGSSPSISSLFSEGSGPKPEFIDALINSATPQFPTPPPPSKEEDIEKIVHRVAQKRMPDPTMPVRKMDPGALGMAQHGPRRRWWLWTGLAAAVVLVAGLVYWIFGTERLEQSSVLERLIEADNTALRDEVSRLSDYMLSHEDEKWVRRLYALGYLKARLVGWYSPLLPKGRVGDPVVDGLMDVFALMEEGNLMKALKELEKVDDFLTGCPLCVSIAARMYVILDRPRKAEKLLTSLKFKGKMGPTDACLLAQLLVESGRVQEASETLEFVDSSNQPCLVLARARLEMARGELEVAHRLLLGLKHKKGLSSRLRRCVELTAGIADALRGEKAGTPEDLDSIRELIPDWDLRVRTLYANFAMYLGDHARASKELKSILTSYPTHSEARRLRRETLFMLGRIGDILKEGRDAGTDPVVVLAYLVYGDVPRAQRMMVEWGAPNTPLKRIASALLNVRLGRPGPAEEVLGTQPPEGNPYSPLWAWMKSEILVARGVTCKNAVRPIAKYGKRGRLWKGLVELECLLKTRQWTRAVELYNRTVKEFRSSDILEPLGFSIMRVMGEFKELAPRLSEYVATLSSAHYQWYVHLAEAYRNLRQWKDAMKALDEGLKHGLPGEEYYLELARLYLKRHYWRSMDRVLRKLEATRNPSVALQRDVYRAVAWSHRRRVEKAFKLLEPYASVYDPRVFWAFGELYCGSDDLEQALKFYDSALQLARRSGYTPWQLSSIAADKARCLAEAEQYNAAIKAAVAALAFTPLQYEASLVMARIYYDANDRRNALYYYNAVVKACPTHPEAVCRLGFLLGASDRTGLAYLKLCRSLRDAPRKFKRKAARMMR